MNAPFAKTDGRDWPSSNLRWALLGAFVGLLGLMLVSGAAAMRLLAEMHREEQEARHGFAERTQRLSNLCLSTLMYNEAIQRYVLTQFAGAGPDLDTELDRLTGEIDSGLSHYPESRRSDELEFLQAILRLFQEQRHLIDSVRRMSSVERLRSAPEIMVTEVLPWRAEILDWWERLRVWNAQQLQRSDVALLAEFDTLQASLVRSLSIALASGLLLVVASMAYILRLERQMRARYQELAQSRHELERLSSRLVDAQETERRSISRELHDEVGQSLGALLVDLGRLSANVPDGFPGLKDQLDRMKLVAERTVRTVRNIALLLRPSMLDDLGLVAALEWQGRELSRRSDTEVDVQSENVSDNLPDEYRVCIYRLVQEALNNTARHSEAKNAWVKVEQNGERILVRVSDDGHGFDPARARGLGILGMEERVRRLGGSLRIESGPGRGTMLQAELPLPKSEQADEKPNLSHDAL
jgi:signal transduction histidine kinase